jgi:hypothetical protein
VGRRLTAFPVKEINTRIRSTSPFTGTPGACLSSGASEGKRKRFCSKKKQQFFVTHGVAKPVHGASTCSFCLSFRREQRTPPVSAEYGKFRKRQRKPSPIPWSISDTSCARIVEHYENSRPKRWGKLKERVVAADVMCAAAVQQFFYRNKLEAQFRRATPGSVKIT